MSKGAPRKTALSPNSFTRTSPEIGTARSHFFFPFAAFLAGRKTVPTLSPRNTAASIAVSMFPDRHTIVLHPAAHAILAAVSFVTIPPVPTDDPAPPTSTSKSLMFSTTSMRRAFGSVCGLEVYNPSTSVSKKSHRASTKAATCALSVSLSPNFSSSTATVSFSFTTGTTPISNSAPNVFLAQTYCFRLLKFSSVNSTCAHLIPMVLKMSS
mmetsp:Transcript_7557/g.25243  ORF Transcript_7557/g.25243 Transcript_7557/m.25243 type:complete len:211 (+) Transcript_7557:374-1006(+)